VQLNLSSGESVVRGDIILASSGTHSRSVRIFKIVDATQRTCGYLHYFPGTLSPPTWTQNRRELVGLSQSQYPDSKGRPEAVYKGSSGKIDNYSILFDHKTFEQRPWCLLNVMLVEWKGSETERVTIGQIHKDAWDNLKTQRKRITLV